MMQFSRLKNANIFALFLLVLYYTLSFVIGSLSAVIPALAQTEWLSLILYLFGFGIPILLYAVFMKRRRLQPVTYTFRLKKLTLKNLLILVALGFLIQPVATVIAQLSAMVFSDVVTPTMTKESAAMPMAMTLLTTALLPALFEEFFCRGVLLDGTRQAPVRYQLLIPALFFGFLHGNFQQIAYAIPLGIFLALVVLITHSLWASILVHFIFNSTQVILNFFSSHGSLPAFMNTETLSDKDQLISSSLLGLGCLILVILLVQALSKDRRTKHPEEAGRPLGFEPLPLKEEELDRIPVRLPDGSLISAPAPRKNWHEGGWIMYVLLALLFAAAVVFELMAPYMNQLTNSGFGG